MGYKKYKFITLIAIITLLIVSFAVFISGNIAKSNKDNPSAADLITEISSLDDLKQFRDSVNEGNDYRGITVTLSADINMNNDSNWEPIGYEQIESSIIQRPFRGTFNGGNHSITGFAGKSGLFGFIDGATIRNLKVTANSSSPRQ